MKAKKSFIGMASLLFMTSVSQAIACPSLNGTWQGSCSGTGKPGYDLRVAIEQNGCLGLKIKSFVNGSLASIENIQTGEPSASFIFSPDDEWAANSGLIGLWRFQSSFQTLRQNFSADVSGSPKNVSIMVHSKLYLLFSETILFLTDELWLYSIPDPAYPPDGQSKVHYELNCSLTKVLP